MTWHPRAARDHHEPSTCTAPAGSDYATSCRPYRNQPNPNCKAQFIEPGEDPLTALRRELREKTGLTIAVDPPHVWHQEVWHKKIAADHAPGFDGLINDYFLIRASHFQPRGELTNDQLAADENLAAFRWWPLSEIVSYACCEVFSLRDLATPLTALMTTGTPTDPVQLGL